MYISLIPTGTTTSCLAGHIIRVPFLSILCIYLALLILVSLSTERYSSLNYLRSSDEVCISTRWLVIGFVLIVYSWGVFLSQFWNHLYKGIDLPSCTRSHIAQWNIICLVAPFLLPIAWPAEYRSITACCLGRRILFCPLCYMGSIVLVCTILFLARLYFYSKASSLSI